MAITAANRRHAPAIAARVFIAIAAAVATAVFSYALLQSPAPPVRPNIPTSVPPPIVAHSPADAGLLRS